MSNLKCEICGDGLDNNPDKFALERTNPKGVPGKWRCVDRGACVDRKLKRDFYDSHRPTTAHS